MNISRRHLIATTTTTIAIASLFTAALPASAREQVVADNLASPLGFAVAHDGTLYVAQSFAGKLTQIDPGGMRSELATAPPGSVTAGVARNHRGGVYYTISSPAEQGGTGDSSLGLLRPNGSMKTLASLSDYEAANNPDANAVYGLQHEGACWDAVSRFPKRMGPPQYGGEVDSNPYAVANEGFGSVLVADAGGNDIVRVDHGQVSTVAVLPPIKQTLTKQAVRQQMRQINRQRARNGKDPIRSDFLDPCIGEKYASNPVPTDVEMGRDGMAYVSTLPGGPELPGYGRVFQLDPQTGALHTVVKGLTSATDLAVARDGTMYVTELFAGQVAVIDPGDMMPSRMVAIDCPTAVEMGPRRRVYVAHNGLCTDTPGEIVKLPR